MRNSYSLCAYPRAGGGVLYVPCGIDVSLFSEKGSADPEAGVRSICSGYGLTGAFDQLVVSSGIWPGADPQSADIHAFRWRNGGNLAASLLDGNAGVSYYRCWNTLVSLSHHDLSSGYQIVGYGLAGDLELSAEEILLPPGIHHRLQTGASQRYPNAAQPERMSSTVPDYHPDLLSVCHSLPDGYGRAFGIGGK